MRGLFVTAEGTDIDVETIVAIGPRNDSEFVDVEGAEIMICSGHTILTEEKLTVVRNRWIDAMKQLEVQ